MEEPRPPGSATRESLNEGPGIHDTPCYHTTSQARQRKHPQGHFRKDFTRARNRVLDRRGRVSRGRLRLQKRRAELRRLRNDASDLESNFVSALERGSLLMYRDNRSSLSSLLERVRGMREKIKIRENTHDEDEDALAEDEYILEAEEARFYQTFEMNLISDDDEASTTKSSSLDPSLSPMRYSSPKTMNPLYQYETRIGEARIMRERLDGLRFRREEHLQEKQNLDSLGLEMNPRNLEFLSTYDQTYSSLLHDLAAVVEEIKTLEQAAIDDGYLEPSMAVANLGSFLPEALMLEEDATPLRDNTSELLSVIQMPVEIPNVRTALVDRINLTAGPDHLPMKSPTADIYQWLQDLPVFPVAKAGNFVRHENSWMRPVVKCTKWVAGLWYRDKPIEPPRTKKSLTCSTCDHWVNIKPTSSRVPRPHADLDHAVRTHSTEELRSPPDTSVVGEIREDIDLAIHSRFHPPNASHDTPMYGLDPGVDDRESRSV